AAATPDEATARNACRTGSTRSPHATSPGRRCGRSCCTRGTGGACRGSNGQSQLPPGLVRGRVRGVLRAVLAPTRPDLAAVVPAHLRWVSLAQAVLGHEVGHLGARWADHRTAPWVVRSVTGGSHSTGHRYGFGPAPRGFGWRGGLFDHASRVSAWHGVPGGHGHTRSRPRSSCRCVNTHERDSFRAPTVYVSGPSPCSQLAWSSTTASCG